MALTDMVDWMKPLLDPVFDKPDFNIKANIKAEPLTNNNSLVGMAFDYVLRLQVARVNKELVASFPIAAEHGIYGVPDRRVFIDSFKESVELYMADKVELDRLLSECITLAKIETIYRIGGEASTRIFPYNELYSFDKADVDDLKNLTKLLDLNVWQANKRCILNPLFGESSRYVGGADADLIIDDKLIDIKTTKHLTFKREFFRQLIGYSILNWREGHMYKGINYLGIYFSRFGVLFTFPIPNPHKAMYQGEEIDEYTLLALIEQYHEWLEKPHSATQYLASLVRQAETNKDER